MRIQPFVLPLALLAACSSEASQKDAPTKSGSPAKSASSKTLKFSAIPNEDRDMLRSKFDPVAKYLADKLGIKVEYVPAADYAASVEMFKNGEIQMAWFGGFTGVQARLAVPGSRAIAMGESDANYKSYFIAPKDTSLKPESKFLEGAAGKKFAFGSEGSTSGRLMPEYFIRKETGKAPKEFFSEVQYTKGHDATIEQVKAGSFDLGVVDFQVYEGQVDEGKLKKEDCPVIWVTPTYADYQFTVRPELEKEFGTGFTKRLVAAIVGMGPKESDAFRRKKMVPATNEHFKGIEETARAVGLIR